MADPRFYLDDMDACRVHGIGSMRFTLPENEYGHKPVSNLDNWACSLCDFKPSEIDWVAVIREEQG